MTKPSKHVLFLCTGNYYRSRFAEELFNHLAVDVGLNWKADSSALALELGKFNIGPISRETLAQLQACGVDCQSPRSPKQCSLTELENADLVVALKEAEHRPLLSRRYAGWEERVEYWHVHDLDQSTADVALAQIEQQVRSLVKRLREQNHV